MVAVYRLEHAKSRQGPYCYNGACRLIREAHGPYYAGSHRPATAVWDGVHGCLSAGALRRWFGRQLIRRLVAEGFLVVRYRVPATAIRTWEGGQVTFPLAGVWDREVLKG